MTRLRLSIAALLCLISTSAWADLRTFDVDFQYRQEVYQALRNLLDNVGRVELLPSGQILVNASPEMLEQVEQLLGAIRARPAAATPRVTLRYWAVFGTRGSSTAANQQGQRDRIAEVTVVQQAPSARGTTPLPTVLNGVVAELERFHGDLTFRVLGTAAVVSESGQDGVVAGTPLTVSQEAHVQGDTLNAKITIVVSPVGQLEVRTSLKRGEFVVLGENTQQYNDVDGTLFYIVHWPENE